MMPAMGEYLKSKILAIGKVCSAFLPSLELEFDPGRAQFDHRGDRRRRRHLVPLKRFCFPSLSESSDRSITSALFHMLLACCPRGVLALVGLEGLLH